MGAASRLAEERGEPMRPAHLLVAVLDQGDAEVTRALENADIRAADARSLALNILGAFSDLPRLTMPSITPAGTWDRPAIDVSELDQGAWESLCWRQERLPLGRVRHEWQWSALSSLEQGAAWRVANRYRVDEDQRYSLLSHHHDRVEALAHQAHPELVETRQQMRETDQSGPNVPFVSRRRRVWEKGASPRSWLAGRPGSLTAGQASATSTSGWSHGGTTEDNLVPQGERAGNADSLPSVAGSTIDAESAFSSTAVKARRPPGRQRALRTEGGAA